MDVITATDEERLLSWYQNVLVRRFDLVGDYAGNELFLIEGDSLLLHCLLTSKVDFDGGFQMLHAVHAVESFLQALLRRKCNFDLAFFDQHRELCVPDDIRATNRDKFLLTREVLIRHLQKNLQEIEHPGFQVMTFRSIESDDFNDYLASSDVYFFLCHDGASSESINRSDLDSKQQGGTRPCDHQGSSCKIGTQNDSCDQPAKKAAFRFMIYTLIRQGYGVALVNGMEWRDSKVITSIVEGHGKSLPTLSMDFAYCRPRDECTEVKIPMQSLQNLIFLKDLTERDALTIFVLGELLQQGCSDHKLLQASALILHTAVLNTYPLAARRFEKLPVRREDEEFLLLFSQRARETLENASYLQILEKTSRPYNIVDLVDGRVFNAAAHTLNQSSKTGLGDPLLNQEYQRLEAVFVDYHKIKMVFSPTQSLPAKEPSTDPTTTTSVSKNSSVMPFQNSIFDHHLAPVTLTIDDKFAKEDRPAAAQTFKELSHWHNSKKPLGRKEMPVKLGFYAHRRNQKFMAEMMAYAASLTNSVGKVLEPEIVVVAPRTVRVNDQKKPKGQATKDSAKNTASQQGSKSKAAAPNKGKAAAHAAVAATQAKKTNAKEQQSIATWGSHCKTREKLELVVRYIDAQRYRDSLGKPELRLLGPEVELYMAGVLVAMWIKYCKEKRKDQGMDTVALLWHHIAHLVTLEGLTRPIWSQVELTIKTLRLPRLAVSTPPTSNRPLSFEYPLNRPAQVDLSIPMNPFDFQLLHCGPYLDRSMESRPDDRVPFEPDGWQRKVLDTIDARKSLFVVAPTSTGKTFISFYAMKQVLHSSDEDILVYVAPTKALVSQIAAEIQARFSKAYPHKSRSVWAIHTRDYRINSPVGCQILVTVPHILQIMLLAPSNAEKKDSWSCRVKRIIFDEVHCIGQAEDGIVWEQLLMLAPCPIIALSATVGNPEEFNDWLKCTQASVGHEVVIIKHPHRYSDLRKFIYVPPKKFAFKGLRRQTQLSLTGLDASCYSTGGFAFVHPATSLVNTSRGIPDDLALEARDCFNLWRAMSERQTNAFKLDNSLTPSEALPETVRKIDVITWETRLKKVLRVWMSDISSPFESVRLSLRTNVNVSQVEDTDISGESSVQDNDEIQLVDASDLCSTTLPLLSDLHSRDALPGILFNYDRTMCEKICEKVLEQLKAAETMWKASSPKWAKKMADYENWQKGQRKTTRKDATAVGGGKKKRGNDEDDDGSKGSQDREANDPASTWESFDPDGPTDAFRFSDNKKLAMSELERYIRQLRWQKQPDWLLEALQRGIAVHHSGMNRKYRQMYVSRWTISGLQSLLMNEFSVEILFRRGFLRVVIATGTLALGINMPCKTVVFSGDSVFLTALNFRQAAGRAGRRGFDLLGNVIFQGISQDKVYRLLSSRLPDLNGHFPISTTLVLRLFTLLHESKQSTFAVEAINSLLSQPRLYLGGPEAKSTVLHHLRFSIEYLRRQSLLGMDGAPLNFAGCVSHLYFTEKSSFAFHALLKEGYFHELCVDIDRNPERVLRTMMLVLAHLFGRIPCRQADAEWIERVVTRSPSIVFLPKLPVNAETVLQRHNAEILDTFKSYVNTFIDQHIEEDDYRLPLTAVKCGGDGPVSNTSRIQPLPKTTLRSPFVALSGCDDNFESIGDLCRNIRSGVFLEESVIPHIDIAPYDTDGPLNAYLYDFYRHASVEALRKANGIRKGDVWFLLNDFSRILATIITSLENFIKPGQNSGLDLADIQGSGEAHEEDSENSDSGAQDGDDETAQPWESDQSLVKVLQAFRLLREDFDIKFRAMWA